MVSELVGVLAAYLAGSIPFGLLLARLMGKPDLRRTGSGNIGATNALRSGGATLGIATLLLDAGKGAAGYVLGTLVAGEGAAPWLGGAVVFAPVAGHCFPAWLRFRGGKGVATMLGVLLVLDARLFAVAAVAMLALAIPTRYVSLGSLGAALAATVFSFWLYGATAVSWGLAAVAATVFHRHRSNIGRLVSGTEARVGGGSGARS